MAWVGLKKADDMVPETWIIDCVKMCKISENVINIVKNTMKNWIVLQTAGKKILLDENPDSDLPGICAISSTICNNEVASQSHT